ncbi:MAG: glycosyltransferase [Planctomycetes bacterium]|nr:glycosyltransferase [Planctomycetota bacterium]
MGLMDAGLYAYLTVLSILAVYGAHRLHLIYLYRRARQNDPPPARCFEALPRVTVQLPLFNEMYVAERLIDAVAALDYPRDKLEIQVLDDSTDETTDIVAARVGALRAEGFDAVHIHREVRSGFKAGALENGLGQARGEFVAIFDADFVPQPDMLQRTIHYFADPGVGMVQTRWGHINRRFSLLTQVQSIYLDGHFVVEHTARNRSGRFFNFNGTGGIWRRSAIADAGGWQHDTLTEDLDLSYRAQLKGWRFVFLKDVVSPAEVPVDMNAFKSQQFRWAKGSAQTMKKLLPLIWKSAFPLRVKLEATFHLTANVGYPLMVCLSLLMLPAVKARAGFEVGAMEIAYDVCLFLTAFVGVCYFYVFSQQEIHRPLADRFRFLPALLAVGIGMCLNNTKAVLEGFLGIDSPFTRTPKHAVHERSGDWLAKRYRGVRTMLPLLELSMAAYFAYILYFAVSRGLFALVFFLLIFQCGYLYVGLLSLFQRGFLRELRGLFRPA